MSTLHCWGGSAARKDKQVLEVRLHASLRIVLQVGGGAGARVAHAASAARHHQLRLRPRHAIWRPQTGARSLGCGVRLMISSYVRVDAAMPGGW